MFPFLDRVGRHLPFIIFFGILASAMTYPLLFNLNNYVPSDLGDPLYNIWVMEWNLHGIEKGFKDFWDANIFFPHKGTLLYADYLPALSIMSFPIARLSGNMIFSYNILFIASFFLSAIGMYFLVLHLTKSMTSAVISGLIFGFFPYRFAHISHLELLYFAWIPLCFLFLHRFFERQTFKNLLGFAIFYVIQWLSCGYYGVFLTLFAGLYILYSAHKTGLFRNRGFWKKMGITSVACFIALAPFFYPYIKVHRQMSFSRPLYEVEYCSAQIQHFIAAPPWNRAWGWLTGHIGAQEWQLYPGIIPVFLVFYWLFKRKKLLGNRIKEKKSKIFSYWDRLNILFLSLILWILISGGFTFKFWIVKISAHGLKKPVTLLGISIFLRIVLSRKARNRLSKWLKPINPLQRFYLFATIFAWILSMGPMIKFLDQEICYGPYRFLFELVPGFKGLRAPSRLEVMMMFGLSVLSGWGVLHLIKSLRIQSLKLLIPWIFGVLILIEYISIPIPLAQVNDRGKIPPVYAFIKELPEQSSLIELPIPESHQDDYKEAVYMYYSTYHWRNLVNGYSGYFPPDYLIIRKVMQSFPSPELFDLLRSLKVDYILIHSKKFPENRGKQIVEYLESQLNHVELVIMTNGDYLYRIIP